MKGGICMNNRLNSFTNTYANSIKECAEFYLKLHQNNIFETYLYLKILEESSSNSDTKKLLIECIHYLNNL